MILLTLNGQNVWKEKYVGIVSLSPSPEVKSRKLYSVTCYFQEQHQISPDYESSHWWSFLTSQTCLLNYYWLTLLKFLFWFIYLKYLLYLFTKSFLFSVHPSDFFFLSIKNDWVAILLCAWNICDKIAVLQFKSSIHILLVF